jgi:hypothetical protein
VSGAQFADGFEEALVGIGTAFDTDIAVYDFGRCVDVLVQRDGMDYEEAVEYMEYNVTGSFVGDNTPVFIRWSIEEYEQL